MNKKLQIAIVILNWNGIKDTLECLESVSKSKSTKYTFLVYVVDNASKKDELKQIKQKFPKCTFIQNKANLGFSGGNNVAIKQALADGAEYVVLLNNDTTVNPTTFDQLVAGAISAKFDLASPKIYFYPGNEFYAKEYSKAERGKVIWYAGGRIDWDNVIAQHVGVDEVDHGQWEKVQETDFATGCCLLVHKKVFKTIGFLDETYTAYFEDTDFCIKALRHGFKVGYVPHSTMWHKNAGSTGGSGSKSQTDLVDRSRFIFAMRYAPVRAKLAIIRNKIFNNIQ